MMSALNLRPLSAGDILDQAFSLYRKNFVLLAGIVAVTALPLIVLQTAGAALPFLALSSASDNPAVGGLALLGSSLSCLSSLLSLVAALFQITALTFAVSERYFGRTTTIRQAYAQTLRFLGPLIIASIIVGVVDGVMFVFLGLCAVFTLLIGLIPMLFVILAVNVRWMFSFQAILFDRLDGVAALRRSWHLVTGQYWRTLGVALAIVSLYYLLSLGPTYLLIALALWLADATWMLVVASSVGGLFASFLLPIQVAAVTVLYYDLRVRKEGLDLQLRAQQLASA